MTTSAIERILKVSPPGDHFCHLNVEKRKSRLDKCPRCMEVTIYEEVLASNEKTNNIARYFGSYLFSHVNDKLHNNIGMILEKGTPLEVHIRNVAPLTCKLLKCYLRDVLSGLSFPHSYNRFRHDRSQAIQLGHFSDWTPATNRFWTGKM